MALDQGTPEAERRPLPAAARRAYSLLCLEGDPDVQARLARMLTLRGHRVVGTVSGDGALALMGEWPVDLVLVADQLRGASGLPEVRRLAKAHPLIPIAVMASEPTPALERAAHQAGAIAVLTRPLTVDHLERLMQALVAGHSISLRSEALAADGTAAE